MHLTASNRLCAMCEVGCVPQPCLKQSWVRCIYLLPTDTEPTIDAYLLPTRYLPTYYVAVCSCGYMGEDWRLGP